MDDRASYPGRWKAWLETRQARAANPPSDLARGVGPAAVNFAFMHGLNLVPYLMFGMVLARGRRWTVFLLPLLPVYALTTVRKWVPRRSSR